MFFSSKIKYVIRKPLNEKKKQTAIPPPLFIKLKMEKFTIGI